MAAARAPQNCVSVCPEGINVGDAEHWIGCKGRAPAAWVTDDLQPLSYFCSGQMVPALPRLAYHPCYSTDKYWCSLAGALPCPESFLSERLDSVFRTLSVLQQCGR